MMPTNHAKTPELEGTAVKATENQRNQDRHIQLAGDSDHRGRHLTRDIRRRQHSGTHRGE